MKSIWKVEMNLDKQTTTVKLPPDAMPIHVHEQAGKVCVWLLVDPNAPCTHRRKFALYGTGHAISDAIVGKNIVSGNYVGTAHLMAGELVLHVFDLGNE